MRRWLKATGLVTCCALVACSQVVDFDRSKISRGGSMDGGGPGGTHDARVPIPDASGDAGDAGRVGCDPATHAGCTLDKLCCDVDSDGTFRCVATSPAQCAACGVACGGDVADSCTERTCGCGWLSKVACGGATPVCDAVSGTCVECISATDAGCGGTKPLCNDAGACVACTAAAPPKVCSGGQVCLPNGACQCSSSADCTMPGEPICDDATKMCRGCHAAGGECATKTPGTVCVESTGRCGLCDPATSAQCSGTTPICAAASLTCQACNAAGIDARACDDKPGAAGECVTGATAAPVGACATCDPASDTGCSKVAINDQCKDGAAPACVDCDATGGCASGEQCYTDANTCVDCVDDAGCTTSDRGTRCNTGSRVCQCTGDGDCTSVVGKNKCDTGTGVCVACLTSTDCAASAAAPICVNRACVACATDAQCQARNAGTVCVTGGGGMAVVGSCAACDPVDHGGCTVAGLDQCKAGATPECVDCVDNAGCLASTRGAKCNVTSHVCQCLTKSDCAGGLACKSNTCQACAGDADCEGGTCNLMSSVCM